MQASSPLCPHLFPVPALQPFRSTDFGNQCGGTVACVLLHVKRKDAQLAYARFPSLEGVFAGVGWSGLPPHTVLSGCARHTVTKGVVTFSGYGAQEPSRCLGLKSHALSPSPCACPLVSEGRFSQPCSSGTCWSRLCRSPRHLLTLRVLLKEVC